MNNALLKKDTSLLLPAIIANEGDRVGKRFVEFFTANIRNQNTRDAYARAAAQFFFFCEKNRVSLADIEPVIVAAYIEQLSKERTAPTVKQHLAALRMLFDWLVIGQCLPYNPASSVRSPRYSVKKGKTPVLSAEDCRTLLDSIDTSHVVGLRDRALIGLMVFSFARISAVVNMRVSDYYQNGKRFWVRLHEKGGKFHEVPAHHTAEEYLDAYIDHAGLKDTPKGYLFRSSIGRSRQLTDRGLDRREALAMIKRRVKDAGLSDKVTCHTFRATGITEYLRNGGTIEKAAQIAAHESTRTTQLYNRVDDALSLDEIERVRI